MSPAGSTAILSALPKESWPACWRSYKAPGPGSNLPMNKEIT